MKKKFIKSLEEWKLIKEALINSYQLAQKKISEILNDELPYDKFKILDKKVAIDKFKITSNLHKDQTEYITHIIVNFNKIEDISDNLISKLKQSTIQTGWYLAAIFPIDKQGKDISIDDKKYNYENFRNITENFYRICFQFESNFDVNRKLGEDFEFLYHATLSSNLNSIKIKWFRT